MLTSVRVMQVLMELHNVSASWWWVLHHEHTGSHDGAVTGHSSRQSSRGGSLQQPHHLQPQWHWGTLDPLDTTALVTTQTVPISNYPCSEESLESERSDCFPIGVVITSNITREVSLQEDDVGWLKCVTLVMQWRLTLTLLIFWSPLFHIQYQRFKSAQDQTVDNWTVDGSGTYLAGPAEPV